MFGFDGDGPWLWRSLATTDQIWTSAIGLEITAANQFCGDFKIKPFVIIPELHSGVV